MEPDAVIRSAAQLPDHDLIAGILDADRLDAIAAEATELNLEVIEYAREHPEAREQLRALATRLAFIGAHATLQARFMRAAETRHKNGPPLLRALMQPVDRSVGMQRRCALSPLARRRGPSRRHRPVVRRVRRGASARSPGRPQPDDDLLHDVVALPVAA